MVLTDARREQVRQGGRLARLYREHVARAKRLAFLLTGDYALAEDLTQDAFVKVFGRFQDLRNPGAFWWYLRRTIVNLSKSHFRRQKVEREKAPALLETEAAEQPSLEEHDEMRRALLQLSERQRSAVVLRYYEDLTEETTAEVLGCTVGTVKQHVSRGMAKLREVMGE